MIKKLLLILALLLVPVVGKTQNLTNAPIVFTSGSWMVKLTTEDTSLSSPPMCVALYTDSSINVQYANDTMYVDARPYGGVDSLALRLAGSDIILGRPANPVEQHAGIVVFGGTHFRELLYFQGMRLAIFSPTKHPAVMDIVFDGLQDVYDFMRLAPSKCHPPVTAPRGASEGD